MKKKQKSNETPKISLRLGAKEIAALNELATQHGHTFSGYVRHVLRKHISNGVVAA